MQQNAFIELDLSPLYINREKKYIHSKNQLQYDIRQCSWSNIVFKLNDIFEKKKIEREYPAQINKK